MLIQGFADKHFKISSDGSGGTNITVVPTAPAKKRTTGARPDESASSRNRSRQRGSARLWALALIDIAKARIKYFSQAQQGEL
jgi:hypothetical protein